MGQLGAALSLTWASVQQMPVAGAVLRYTYSREGPPYIELLCGPPGSPWSAEETRGFHHSGFWCSPLDAAVEHLMVCGLKLEYHGREVGRQFAYLVDAHGFRIELVDVERRDGLLRWLAEDWPG